MQKSALRLVCSISYVVFGLLLVGFGMMAGKMSSPMPVQAQELDYQCMGEKLAEYMNATIDGAGNGKLPKIRLLAPAFSLSSPDSQTIFDEMEKAGANFDQIDGFSGNAYTAFDGSKTAYNFYEDWKGRFSKYGKPMVFTEFGDIATCSDSECASRGALDRRPDIISRMSNVHSTTAGDPTVSSIIYFSPLEYTIYGGNPGWQGFNLSNAEISNVLGSKGGANSASPLEGGGGFPRKVRASASFEWLLEIAQSPGDINTALDSANVAIDLGITPVYRLCYNDDCGFVNPDDLVNFLKQLDAGAKGVVWVIAGPNEPLYEHWATKDCGGGEQRPVEEGFTVGQYQCSETADPEFHPVRPYPANACDPLIPYSEPATGPVDDLGRYMKYSCGSNLQPLGVEGFDPYGDNGYYESLPPIENGAGKKYAHTVCERNGLDVTCWRSSSFDLTVDLSDTNIGVLGNTQDLGLSDGQKASNYLSYYLGGVPQTSDHVADADIDKLISYSGPLRKLLPWSLQNSQARSTIALGGKETVNIHNYSEGDQAASEPRLADFNLPPDSSNYGEGEEDKYWRKVLSWYKTNWASLFQNLPLGGLEDTAGEYVFSVFQPGQTSANMQDPAVVEPKGAPGGGDTTAETEVIITKAVPAN